MFTVYCSLLIVHCLLFTPLAKFLRTSPWFNDGCFALPRRASTQRIIYLNCLFTEMR